MCGGKEIRVEQAIPLIIDACPSCASLIDQEMVDAGLWHPIFGSIGCYIVDLLERKEVDDFPALFSVIERLTLEGDNYVLEATVVGLLEAIQNHAGHRGIDTEQFRPYLLPDTAYWWDELNDFWRGNGLIGTNRPRPQMPPL